MTCWEAGVAHRVVQANFGASGSHTAHAGSQWLMFKPSKIDRLDFQPREIAAQPPGMEVTFCTVPPRCAPRRTLQRAVTPRQAAMASLAADWPHSAFRLDSGQVPSTNGQGFDSFLLSSCRGLTKLPSVRTERRKLQRHALKINHSRRLKLHHGQKGPIVEAGNHAVKRG